jgi:hypothetical protein
MNKPPNMQRYKNGALDSLAPGKMSAAHITAKAMKNTPTPTEMGFPVTFTVRLAKAWIGIVNVSWETAQVFRQVLVNDVTGDMVTRSVFQATG